ncbi:MAG: hypothetical protein ACREAE_07465 [Nitrosopumilaceae archaeon]
MSTEPSSDTTEKPKISILGVLHICWTLSMRFSSNGTQNEVGRNFYDDFFKTFENGLDKGTLFQMRAAIGKTLRNIGYIRNGYDEYKKILDEAYKNKIDVFNGLGSITSISKESLSAKIILFLSSGLGSEEILKRYFTQMTTQVVTKLPNGTDLSNKTATEAVVASSQMDKHCS